MQYGGSWNCQYLFLGASAVPPTVSESRQYLEQIMLGVFLIAAVPAGRHSVHQSWKTGNLEDMKHRRPNLKVQDVLRHAPISVNHLPTFTL